MNRIAVLSDIHGNRWALEAVLEDIERNPVDAVLNLGDVLYGPLDPGGTRRGSGTGVAKPSRRMTYC